MCEIADKKAAYNEVRLYAQKVITVNILGLGEGVLTWLITKYKISGIFQDKRSHNGLGFVLLSNNIPTCSYELLLLKKGTEKLESNSPTNLHNTQKNWREVDGTKICAKIGLFFHFFSAPFDIFLESYPVLESIWT